MNLQRKSAAFQAPLDGPTIWESLGLAASEENSFAAERTARELQAICRFWIVIFLLKLATFAFIFFTADSGIELFQSTAGLLALVSLATDAIVFGMTAWTARFKIKPHIKLRMLIGLSFLSSLFLAVFLLTSNGLLVTVDLAVYAMALHCAMTVVVTLVAGKQRLIGLAFSLSIALTMANSLPLPIVLLVSVSYLASIAYVLSANIKFDIAENRFVERKRQHEKRARLLLNAFEKSALGWFWETDRNGRITYISDSIRKHAADRFDDLIGMSLTDLIMPHDSGDDTPSGERTLGFHLSSRSAFKEIAVRSIVSEEERWWSLSGNPIINSFGQFQGFRGSGADLTEMRKSQEEVKQLAQFDSLTGLSNRLQMQGILEKAIVGPTGDPRPCALFLLDLDRFKSVNDTLGHPAGDALLKQVSKRLERTIGSDGHAGRLGGDEFKVVLPGIIDRKALGNLASAVISSLSQPYTIEGTQVVIGASIGVAIAPEHGSTTQSLVRNADLALYAAKDAGRGMHKFYDKSMHANAEDRRNIEQDLRQALANNELHLVYQPQVSTATEQISGFEALLRWEHPVRGPISPGIFIPIAEEAGLISPIGEWALRTACLEVAQWPEEVKIAVNVSSIQFANPSFPSLVTNALASSGLNPERLELEITESVFLTEGENTDAMFTALKDLGCRLSLDDFGTGYSSLGYLKNAPFDKIKIDQGFVRGASIPGNRNAAIIKSIVSLAEALDMETIAEGAETHDELDLIRSLGCSHVQGYIYSKPLRAEEARPLMAPGAGPLQPQGFKSSRPARRKMLRSVNLIHGDHSYAAQIKNISGRGALVIGLWNVPPDTEFVVEFTPIYRAIAKARWSEDDRTGIEFDRDIDFVQLGNKPPDSARLTWGQRAA